MKLNRRNFIKSVIASLTVLGLGIKAKAREIVTGEIITGVGRGSPRMLDGFGSVASIPSYDIETWTYRTVYNQEPDEIEMLFQRQVLYSILNEFVFSHPPEQWQSLESIMISYDGSRDVKCTIDKIENLPNGDMKVWLTPESRYLMIRPPYDKWHESGLLGYYTKDADFEEVKKAFGA